MKEKSESLTGVEQAMLGTPVRETTGRLTARQAMFQVILVQFPGYTS